MTTYEVFGQRGQSLVLARRPPILDRDVSAFSISDFAETLPKRADTTGERFGRLGTKVSDHRHTRLLSTCYEWPCNGRASEQLDEAAASKMIYCQTPVVLESSVASDKRPGVPCQLKASRL